MITIELEQETDGRWIAEIIRMFPYASIAGYGDTRLAAVERVLELLDDDSDTNK